MLENILITIYNSIKCTIKRRGGVIVAVREIIKADNQLLRRKSRRILNIDDEVLELIQDLKDTLYNADGIGLAAPQIGVLKELL